MKKHIIIFAAAITPLAFFSCTKEHINPEQGNNSVAGTDQQLIQRPAPMPIVDLQFGLEGKFEFNGNLKDKTGQLNDAIYDPISHYRFKPTYTTDRKGVAGQAIEFNGYYGLQVLDVPLDTSMSIAVWVKTAALPTDLTAVVDGAGSLTFGQYQNTYQASSWNGVGPQYVEWGPVGRLWHHLVATRDASSLKFYVDGNLVGSSPTPAGAFLPNTTSDFTLAFGWNGKYLYWKGAMDDLCYYGRTLSYYDVQALYKQ